MFPTVIRAILIYVLLVILFGAWVRMTGSGAGCGEHWPLCDGQVIPRNPETAQIIEYTHRVTSGIFGIFVLFATYLGYRQKNPGVKTAVYVTLFLTIVESLIGAVLVKKGLVAQNDSAWRALVVGLHLANTFFLVAAITFADYLARTPLKRVNHHRGALVVTGCWILVGALGAVTALGDTLFPSESLVAGLKADIAKESHWLIKLRVVHPIFAIGTSIAAFFLLTFYDKKSTPTKILIFANVLFGFVNVFLLVPHWAALTHLLMADLIWIFWLRWYLTNFGERA